MSWTFGALADPDKWYAAANAVTQNLVERETNGGRVVTFNYYPSHFIFSLAPLSALDDFKRAEYEEPCSRVVGPNQRDWVRASDDGAPRCVPGVRSGPSQRCGDGQCHQC